MGKIALLTYHPLTAINGGTIMYQSIIQNIPNEELIWIATGTPNFIIPNWMQNRKSYIFPSFIFNKLWLKIFTKPGLNIIHSFILYKIYSVLISKRIRKILIDEKINVLWIEGVKQTYIIGNIMLKTTKIPIHLSVNDDIVANAPVYESKIFIKKHFKKLLFGASSIDFISKEMRDFYKEIYNYDKDNYNIFWIGSELKDISEPKINNKIKKFVFYGSIHGFETIKSFCNAIKRLNEAGEDMVLNIYSGADYSYLEKEFDCVHFKGSVTSEELVSIVQEHDLVYVPMSFKKDRYTISRTSLSIKMLFAIQCQIPVFSHGPSYATNVTFVNRNKIGGFSDSLDCEKVIKSIKSITFNDRVEASKNELNLKTKDFDTKTNVEKFVKRLRSYYSN